MGKRLQTIYELLSIYSEAQIDEAITCLPMEYQLIMYDRYGSDLHNPQTSETWNKERSNAFYKKVIPKLKEILREKFPEVSNLKEMNKIDFEYLTTLIDLLKQNKNTDEICSILNIDITKFYADLRDLKDKGLRYYSKYYSDAKIKHRVVENLQELKKANTVSSDRILITEENENKIRLMAISDLHIGNDLARIDLLNRVYNYASKKDIRIILCTGDILDGTYTKGSQIISNPFEQIECFVQNYPRDKNILNFAVAGDHDESILHGLSIDLVSLFEERRPDFVVMGYGTGHLMVKNDKIHLYHRIPGVKYDPLDAALSFVGHSHKYMIDNSASFLKINLPTISSIINLMPTALDIELDFTKGYISAVTVKQIYFAEQDITLSELYYDLTKGRIYDAQGIKNTESFRQKNLEESLVLRKETQISKFNKKYCK